MKPDKARTQNFTVAVSFGCERDAAFEHAETKTVVAMPQPNGTIYTFGRDVNIIWRHGILQVGIQTLSTLFIRCFPRSLLTSTERRAECPSSPGAGSRKLSSDSS